MALLENTPQLHLKEPNRSNLKVWNRLPKALHNVCFLSLYINCIKIYEKREKKRQETLENNIIKE